MKRRNDGRYTATLVYKGKRLFFYGQTKKEAEKKKRDFLTKESRYETEGVQFSVVAKDWWDNHVVNLSPTTAKGYSPSYKRAVAMFGERPANSISPREVSVFVNGLGGSKKTATNQLSVLSSIFKHGINNYNVVGNPCVSVLVTNGRKATHRRALSAEEVKSIQDHTDGLEGFFANLLLYTGLRRGEALALQYNDIDMSNKIINVSKSVYYEGNTPFIKSPKTEAGNRKVVLVDALARLIPTSNDGYIFSKDNGKTPLSNKAATVMWKRFCKQSGLIGVTPHYLRHTYATLLYRSGVDIKTAQYLLGHSDAQTTINIYTHVSETMLKNAFEKLNLTTF